MLIISYIRFNSSVNNLRCIPEAVKEEEYTINSLKYLVRGGSLLGERILDLINRQKAEIEGLQNKLSVLQFKNFDLLRDHKELNIQLESMRSAANSYKMHYEEALAEIERLKEKYDRMKFNLESVLAERGIE